MDTFYNINFILLQYSILCLPVRVRTQTGRSIPRNDIYWFSETGKYVHTYLLNLCVLILTLV